MKLTYVFFSLLLVGQSLYAESGLVRYKVQTDLRDPAQVGALSRWLQAHQFDVAGINWRAGEVEVISDQAGIAYLLSTGLYGHEQYSLDKNASGPDRRYFNPDSLNQKLHALNNAYPTLTRIEQIGTSLQGRPILALLVSSTPDANDARAQDKATVLVDGEHHAREVMTPEIVVDIAETLLAGANSNDEIMHLLQAWNFWLVPMVNPDGSNMVFNGNSMWRKNAHGPQGSPYGVDINRNYIYKWSGCRGSSSSSWAQDYHGASAASEPETQAIMKLAQNIHPALYLSYHSYSELVLYPYGCTNSVTAEDQTFSKIASELSALLPSDDGRGHYDTGTPWQLIYATDGDSMSYMYATFGALAFTFEVNQDFQPSYSLRAPTLAKHRNAWMHLFDRANQNLLKLTVVDAKSGQPVQSTIGISGLSRTQGEPSFSTNSGGRFFKALEPGRYVITAQLSDGRSGQISVDMAKQAQAVMLTVN